MKRLLCIIMSVLIFGSVSMTSMAAQVTGIQVLSFDASIDYSALMKKCAQDGSEYALQMGWIYEQQRNMKIDTLRMSYTKSSYFTDYSTGPDILAAMDRNAKKAKKQAQIDRMKSEHGVAAEVYEYLYLQGYSDPVIAGILGNMMREVGGDTLNLEQWTMFSGYSGYYGLCQWSLYYNPYVNGCDVKGQMDYLMTNIAGAFGSNYEWFLGLTDASEAAMAFGKWYERPAYNEPVRGTNAYTALAWIQK